MNKIIGYDNEFKSLFNHLKNNNLNNSLLITGTKGIGKYFFLIKLIKDYINIKINNDKIIHHSNLINNNSHPNIKIVKKEIDDKTKKLKSFITIDQIRKLNHFSRETAIIDDVPKFIIIDSADDLNLNASNALLKILEEPKKNTFFFLISHKPSVLLPTIKSRCLKINLPNHNFDNFNNILRIRNIKLDDENTRFLFDITNGSPGLSNEYNYEEILEIFNKLITSLSDYDPFTDLNNNLIEILSNFENEKLKIYLSLIKFILIVLNKIKIGLDLNDYYLSSNILKIKNLSDITSTVCINNKLDYLINNENDLFTFNLDKKIFMINFFAVR
jgi:DNA polymerase III subunit delta'